MRNTLDALSVSPPDWQDQIGGGDEDDSSSFVDRVHRLLYLIFVIYLSPQIVMTIL